MTTPATASRGFCLERHLQELYDGNARCALDKPVKVLLSTGLTTEYCIHSQAWQDDTVEPVRVVMIMGIGSPKEAWGMFIGPMLKHWEAAAFARPMQVLVFDNRGSGAADAPWGRYTTSQMAKDTLAVMDQVKWPQANIVGVSMGGMIALEVAAQAPERVLSLVLGCTTRGGYSMPASSKLGMIKMGCSSCSQSLMIDNVLDMNYSCEFLARRMDDSPHTTREKLRPLYCDMLLGKFGRMKPPMSGSLGQGMAVETHFVSDERLEGIANAGFPILIIGGRKDRMIPVQEAEKLREHLPGDHVKLIVFEDAGHSAGIQYMDVVVEEYIRMFARAAGM